MAQPQKLVQPAELVYQFEGLALLVVLDMLDPAERIAFVLHDMFAVPFGEIAPSVDRSRSPMRIWPGSERSSTRSWPPPPAFADST